jgi:tetratricopeptide (TPR) repeat protein
VRAFAVRLHDNASPAALADRLDTGDDMRWKTCGVIAFVVLFVTAPAFGASKKDINDCQQADDLDRAIAGCTRILNDRGESQGYRAIAYNNRGFVWQDKGDLDRAIADYNEAIRLDPKQANAYRNRGNAWREKGDLDRAIADLNEAIRLDPKYANAYVNRGNVWHDKGDLDRAIADYNEATGLNPKELSYRFRGYFYFYMGDFAAAAADLLHANDLADNAYAMLWRYLARGHLKQDGAPELGVNAARLKNKDWPYAVIDFYLGRRSLAEMRAAAGKPDEKCGAEFYIGEWHLLRGSKANARAALLAAADTCPKTFIEYIGAVAELKRLGP